jgi:SAM-dependent methyltransferase
VFGDHYASILPADADASAEIDAAFIHKSLDLASGQTLLDVGCGDGRHAHAFAALGLDVTGLDNSMPQLLRAARRNEASKFNFDILHGDMRTLPRDRAYDVVTCLGSSFGYFDSDEQNRQCLQDMVELLKPGGKLALQVFNRDYLMGVLPCRSWWQGRGCLVLDVADMQFSAGRVRIHRTVVFEDGRQFEHHISMRAYSAHTLAKMLATMGARVIELSGSRDTRGRFYGGASPEIWIFAQRSGDV